MTSIKDLKLYPFQIEAVTNGYLQNQLMVLDTGLGKSVIGIALAGLLIDDNVVDRVLVVCERNKLGEWVEDFEKFTDLDTKRYHGSRRKKLLELEGQERPKVLVTTYETARTDLMVMTNKSKRSQSKSPGVLLEDMNDGTRWLIIYDEMARLMNRGSNVYKAHEYALRALRRHGVRMVGLTATPIERDWENAFNQLRLVDPAHMPNIGDFEDEYISYRDEFGRATYNFLRIPEFVEHVQSLITRKSKYDPDVRDQFPKMTEKVIRVDLDSNHRRIYDMADHLLRDDDGLIIPGGYPYLRQLASHPSALLNSIDREDPSDVAQMLVEALGPEELAALSSPKVEILTSHLRTVVRDQGDKAVVFTFFGQSILPDLERLLTEEGFKVYVYHGGQTTREAERSLIEFKSSEEPCVFLTSDSGAQGINLPEATYVVEYESALTYAKRSQRLNRISRLTSDSVSVHCLTLVATDTVEDNIVQNMLERNEMLDQLNDDEHQAMSAGDRRKLFR